MTLICPLHGRIEAPGGDANKRGEWHRQGSTWIHVCGRAEGAVRPNLNRDNTGERPVTREPARP